MGHSRQRGHADAGSTPRASFRADERTAARRVEARDGTAQIVSLSMSAAGIRR